MAFANIGVAGQSPSVYLPSDVNLANIFLDYGGDQGLYPAPPGTAGYVYTTNQDLKWAFAYDPAFGNDVDTANSIDRVDVSFYCDLWFGQKIKPFFKTGGVKYYLSQFEPTHWPLDASIYGGGGIGNGVQDPTFTYYWPKNPATNLPWTVAAVTAGEFGFELTGVTDPVKSARVRAGYVQIFWGWAGFFGSTNGVPVVAGEGTSECGQSVTVPNAFTNYTSEILEVTPGYGPLSGGTQIQIRGYNFVAGSTVDVGGLPATGVQFVDDQHYLATVAAHAIGFTDVVINEPSGNSVILRNGFQYTLFTRGEDIRRNPGVHIRMGLNTGSNGCTFRVDGDSNPPKYGEKIQIIDELQSPRRLLFAGNVQLVDQIYEGLNTQLAWNVTAVDFTWLLNRRRPFGTYTRTSASDIVKDLINRFAPGFTTNFVQTNLAKISVTFDGTLDLQTCLTIIARMIGGGHWYVDFIQDVHFFHIVPPNISIATAAATNTNTSNATNSTLRVGAGPTLTVTQSATAFGSGYSFTPGIYVFQASSVYDNGVESALGPACIVALDGQHFVSHAIAAGAAVGSLTVVKRRIYVTPYTIVGGSKKYGYAQLNDNTTLSFDSGYSANQVSVAAGIVAFISNTPAEAFVAAPVYSPSTPITASLGIGAAIMCQPEFRPSGQTTQITWTPGAWKFKASNLYQDGTESQLGPESNTFQSDGGTLVHLVNVAIGETKNGVPVIARKIYAAFGSDYYKLWWLIPNNTATSADISANLGSVQNATQSPNAPVPDQPPVWPNDDGPYLEDFNLPDEVNDDNPYLLRSPQVQSTTDGSQIRNKIYLRGGGSSLTEQVAASATQLPVSDTSFYSSSGGQVFVEGQVLSYSGVTVAFGSGNIILNQSVGEALNSGAPVALYLMVEDKASQEDMGRVELDFNGHQTDGIHEFVITDQSLVTPFQLYMRGYAELEIYSRPITSVRFSTRDPKMRPGVRVHVNLTNPPIKGEFLIHEVSIDQIHDEADELLEPRYNVITSSSKFDLGDLFFQWGTKTANPYAGGGGSNPPSNPTNPPVNDPTVDEGFPGTPATPTATNMWTGVSPASGVKIDQVWTSGSTGAFTYPTDNGYWMRIGDTSTGEGGETYTVNIPNVAMFRCELGFNYTITLRAPSSVVTGFGDNGLIIFAGLYEATTLVYDGHANGDTRAVNNTKRFIGFRADGRGWAGLIGDGVNMNEYSAGFHSIAVDQVYFCHIRVISAASVAQPGFGAFYKQNFPGGCIELSVTVVNETSNAFTLRIPTPAGLLGVPLMGFTKGYNGQYPSPNTVKTMDINTAYGSFGPTP